MYYLLNKDQIIAKFSVDPITGIIDILEQRVELPSWCGDLHAFVRNRRAPKGRENIKKLLRLSGCDTLEGFLSISYALSLVDTF